jgi:hypothetical protein
MATTVVGLMNTPREAENLVRDLAASCGCDRADISLATHRDDDMPTRGGGGSGALTGAVAGAVIGAIAGYFASMTSLAIPGIDIALADRPVASALAFAGIGAVVLGVLGGLLSIGRREEDGNYYGMEPRRAGTLVTVHARNNEEADCALGIMRRHGAMEIDKRSSDWAKQDMARREEPALRPDPQATTGGLPSGHDDVHVRNHAPSTPAPAAASAQNHDRPMEETTASARTAAVGTPTAAASTEQKQVAAKADTRNWITRKYTATYFGPERRTAANQNPYQGAERWQSA